MINKSEQLKKLVHQGASNKNIAITDIVLDRISYELSVIESLGCADYFIVYSRIIGICNELNLIRTCGRGSATQSLVNYCLDITKVDPISENLIFERFLNPLQKLLPDIDIDIPKDNQKDIIEKLKQRYPEYHTYQIAFSSQTHTDCDDIYYDNQTYKRHPCGIIVRQERLSDSIIVFEEQEFYLTHDISNDSIYSGKFDIVELEYLNRLQLIVNEIGEEYHPYRLPLNDKVVFDFFASGDLGNVFQLDYPSLNRILVQFKPNSINDLSIICSMFRPGLLAHIPTVISNKFNRKERFGFSDARISEILNETYGLLIYQETFLHLSKEIAGIPFPEAETWRKKIMRDNSNANDLIAFSSVFAKGCKEYSSLSKTEISAFTNMVTDMFPLTYHKAHSLCYTILAYWGAYYKTHFRTEFDNVFKRDESVLIS
ncbi:MAG: hypothetical protein K9G46_06010 [Flavobacteriales bacterium]|nr:hypothetical protein [Flavobacteriales bacterium]